MNKKWILLLENLKHSPIKNPHISVRVIYRLISYNNASLSGPSIHPLVEKELFSFTSVTVSVSPSYSIVIRIKSSVKTSKEIIVSSPLQGEDCPFKVPSLTT